MNWERLASTADGRAGSCSLAASARPSWLLARCTWPSEAEAAASCSNIANLDSQSGPRSAALRRRPTTDIGAASAITERPGAESVLLFVGLAVVHGRLCRFTRR